MPSNALKMSVQAGNQSVVWHNVAAYKSATRVLAQSGAAEAESTTSSVNEELESKPFKKLLEEYGHEVEAVKILHISKDPDESFVEKELPNLESSWAIFLACQSIYELQKQVKKEVKTHDKT